MKVISSKKGQVNAMGPAIIALVIAATFLVLGVIMIQETRDTDIVNEALLNTVGNETFSSVTEAGVATTYAGDLGFKDYTVLIVTNASGGETIPANNYTVDATTGTVTAVGTPHNNSDWNVSATYYTGDQAYRGANESIVGFQTFAGFFEIIVIAFVLAVVIGLLLAVFGGRRAR